MFYKKLKQFLKPYLVLWPMSVPFPTVFQSEAICHHYSYLENTKCVTLNLEKNGGGIFAHEVTVLK